MNLTPQEIELHPTDLRSAGTPEQAYFEAIKAFTNNFHDISHLQNAPLPIRVAVSKWVAYASRDNTVKSESISDLSTTYHDIKGLPNDITSLIYPWCKVGF